MDKTKIIQNLNELFKQRAKFYEFFDENIQAPIKVNKIMKELKTLDDAQLDVILTVINGLRHSSK